MGAEEGRVTCYAPIEKALGTMCSQFWQKSPKGDNREWTDLAKYMYYFFVLIGMVYGKQFVLDPQVKQAIHLTILKGAILKHCTFLIKSYIH